MFDNLFLEKIKDNDLIIIEKTANQHGIFYKNADNSIIKFQMTTPILNVPFGIENYGNNLILNLEIMEINNYVHNFISILKSIDAFFSSLQNINNIDLTKLKYVSCYKERDPPYKPLLRTNIKKFRKKILTEIISDDNCTTLYEITKDQNNKIKTIIELDNLWITNTSYGLNWSVIKIIC
jgi:hypothetical protein